MAGTGKKRPAYDSAGGRKKRSAPPPPHNTSGGSVHHPAYGTKTPPTPSPGKVRQHQGRSRGPAKKKEEKQLREADNTNLYQGASEPDAPKGSKRRKKETDVSKRGRSVRHILAGPNADELKGDTPFQKIKQTARIREAVDNEVKREIRHLTKRLHDPKLDPKTRTEVHGKLTGAKATRKRLSARTHTWAAKELQKALAHESDRMSRIEQRYNKALHEGKLSRKQVGQISKALTHEKIRLRKLAQRMDRHKNMAIKEYRQSHKREKKSEGQLKKAYFTPRAKGTLAITAKLDPTALGSVPNQLKLPSSKTKNYVFDVPNQPIPGDKWGGTLGEDESGYLGKTQIKRLTEAAEHTAGEPSALEAGITAASLAPIPFGPLAKIPLALKGLMETGGSSLAAKGLETVVSGAGAARGVAPVKAGSRVFVVDTSGSTVVREAESLAPNSITNRLPDGTVLSVTHLPDEAAPLVKIAEGNIGKKALDNLAVKDVISNGVPATTKPIAGDSIGGAISDIAATKAPKGVKQALVEKITSKKAMEAEKAWEGTRAYAGGGAVTDVNEAAKRAGAYLYKDWARSALTGTKLRAKRAAIVGAIGGAPLVAYGGVEPHFREAALNDANDLVVGAVPSSMMFLTASGEALWHSLTLGQQGSNSRFTHIIEEWGKTSPIALMAQGKFDEAYKMVQERPVTSLLEFSGAYQGIGKGIGKGMRLAADTPYTFLHPKVDQLMKFAKQSGRDPQVIFGDIKDVRGYSDNVLTKSLQVFGDNWYDKRVKDLKPVYHGARRKGRRIHKDRPEYGSIRKNVLADRHGERMQMRLDKAISEIHSIQLVHTRANMHSIEHEIANEVIRPASKHHKYAPGALTLTAMNLIKSPKTVAQDLRDIKNELEVSRDTDRVNPASDEQRIVEENIDIVDSLIEHQKDIFGDGTIFKLADKYRVLENSRQQQLQQVNALHPDAAAYAPWIPYAVKDMGAYFKRTSKSRGGFYRDVDVPVYEQLPKRKPVRLSRTKGHAKAKKAYNEADARYKEFSLAVKRLRGRKKEEAKIQLGLAYKAKGKAATRLREFERKHKTRLENAEKKRGPEPAPKVLEYKKEPKELSLAEIKHHAETEGGLVDSEGKLIEPAMVTTRIADGADAGSYEHITSLSADNLSTTGRNVSHMSFDMASRALLRQSMLSRLIVDKRRYLQIVHDRAAMRPQGYAHPIYILPKLDKDGHYLKDKFGNDLTSERVARNFIDENFGELYGPELTGVSLRNYLKDYNLLGEALGADVNGFEKTGRDLYGGIVKDAAAGKINAEIRNFINPELLKEFRHGLSDEASKSLENDISIIMPKSVLDHLKAQAKADGDVARVIKRINREFKGSVLAFNPKWHLGNVVDMATRAFFSGVGITSYVQGRRLLNIVKEEDKSGTMYNEVMAAIAGGHIKTAQDAGDFLKHVDKDLALRRESAVQRALVSFFRAGPKGYRWMQRQSFHVGAVLEEQARIAGFGKAAIMRAKTMNSKYLEAYKLTPDVISDLAKGFNNSDNIRNFARYVNGVFGDYTTLSPFERSVVNNYMPFYLWLRASAKFVFTLPAKSPIRTALVASVNRLSEPERRFLGLSVFKGEDEDKQVYPYQRGSIPGPAFGGAEGDLIRTNTYTSFGPYSDLSSLAGFIMPQVDFIGNSLLAKAWTGEDIIMPNGKAPKFPERIGLALLSGLETYVTPLTWGRKFAAEGDPSATYLPFTGQSLSERKHYKNIYTKEVEESPKYPIEASPTSGIAAKIFSPAYISENPVVSKRKEKKEDKKAEARGEEGGADSYNEWLYGVKTEKTRKEKPKTTRKPKDAWENWLYK